MPGIDAALARLNTGEMPQQLRVNYNGWDGEAKQKKPVVSEATIDPAAEGIEKCRKLMAEQEAKIKKMQEKINGVAPTKKNKAEISALKEQLQGLQYDGNYRAVLAYVRRREDEERDARREEREKQEQLESEAIDGVARKSKGLGAPASSSSSETKKKEVVKPTPVDDGPFECDTEVVAVVQSAVDGSEDAQGKLKQGAGATRYTSEVRAEVATIAHATRELLSAKLKRAPTRPQTLATIKALLWHAPAVLPALPAILTLLDEAKLKLEAANLALEVAKAGPAGSRAVPELVIPVLLAHLGAAAGGKWQIKVGTMGVLKNVLPLLVQTCPKQLGWAMPKIMASMRDAASDARKEVRREAEGFLKHMGQEMVGTPEIKGMVDGIVGSLVDSANMEKATEIMSRLANTTFLNAVDSCSFGLLFPIVSRSMRERTHESKTRGVQIMGASVDLIADPEFLHPYVEELMPLLKDCLLDPNASVQREAAKSLGSLAVGLPSLCEEDFYPFLLEKMKSQDVNEDVAEVDRRGAAHGLAEVLLHRLDLLASCLQQTILPQISTGATKEAKAGGLVLFTFLPHLGPQAFLPHLPRCLPVILDALTEDSEVVIKQAVAAMKVIIDEYGSAYPRLLMGRLQEALFFQDEEARNLAMELFYNLCEKITDTLNFGQDFLSMEVLPQWHRHSLLCSIFIAQRDGSHAVKRQATLIWKERLQSGQKAKAEIMPHLLQFLRGLQLSESPAKQAAAKTCLAELMAAGDVTEEELQDMEPQAPAIGADAAAAVDGEEEAAAPPPPRGQLLQRRCATALASVKLLAPLRSYVEAVMTSCCVEAHTRASAEEALEAELLPITDKKALEKAGGSAIAAFGLTAALGQIFEGVADETTRLTRQTSQDADGNVLVRADNLLMMYGGGKILLKNASLELLRGHRYGVVGRNGAGKTTLMQQIANGGVKQMSSRIKTLHVRPEVLIEASELTAVQFCQRDLGSQQASEDSLEAALQKVGFPKEMQAKSVNELSGGWRMKLMLASAMMRECDILLLDEPTNHLDKESVAWLSEYLVSLTGSSLMVISHDPHFLNSVCTDIIQYSGQRTLEYYSGNFADFLKAKEINSEEEAEALLLGQDVEEKAVDEKEATHQEDEVTGLTAGALDKQSKISFPIPGKLQGHSPAKPVVELKNVSFAYNEEEGPMVLKGISCKLTLASRVGIVGANGAGKSTLLNIICGELMPSIGPGCSTIGEVLRHRNLRLAYIAQQHMFHLSEFLKSSPYIYIQRRFKNGWDEALQKRLVEPANAEEAQMRKELASRWGKYGNQVAQIVGRVIRGNEMVYEVQWENLDDPKQNTFEPYTKLKTMGVACLARAYDERTAAQSAGIDQRPLSQREIVKHLEQFGLNEDQVLNQEIGSFSAGQKSKLTLGAAFWTRPHVVALDEPTNYIDMETLDALAKGLARFKGGMVVISHASDFVDRVCNETWLVEGATIANVVKNSGDKKA